MSAVPSEALAERSAPARQRGRIARFFKRVLAFRKGRSTAPKPIEITRPPAKVVVDSVVKPVAAGRKDSIAVTGRVATASSADAKAACDAALCQRFVAARKSLDNDSSVKWVEGWHNVRLNNVKDAVAGIIADQGLFVGKSISYMPEAAYWHGKKPETPKSWSTAGATIHFRIPEVYLKTQGKHVDDRSAGNRFKHEGVSNTPRSKTNPNREIMPIQVLQVYWTHGQIPECASKIGVDMRQCEQWPQR